MSKTKSNSTSILDESKLMCGVVMPISEIDGCTEAHWKDVYEIISEAIAKADFTPNLVSNSDDVGVIQKRIIQNLYENPIVVVDVSGKNPNVMFELGLRLAFDKPTIIIKDDNTKYSFDTSPIEHLEYPRDLRFTKIVDFKGKLTDKILQTYEKSKRDPNFSTFLKHFGSFKITKIETEEVTKEDYIIEELKSLRDLVVRSNRRNSMDYLNSPVGNYDLSDEITICLKGVKMEIINSYIPKLKDIKGVLAVDLNNQEVDHQHLDVKVGKLRSRASIIKSIEAIVGETANYVS